ncbi:transposable element Tcb1 transposase [Trichonephila clavipes]|nr:transposable element Tcb1 transposase [Trichonephila clavipes]
MIEIFHLLDDSRGTVCKIMIPYTQCSKTSSQKGNRGRKEKISERDRLLLKWTVMYEKRTTAAKRTAVLKQHLNSLVSMIPVGRHLHKQNIYGRAAITQPLVTDVNTKPRLPWCHIHKTWPIDMWKK